MSKPMSLKEKVQHYESVLSKIACWEDGEDSIKLDEPAAAFAAREVLLVTGADPPARMIGERYFHQGNLVMVVRKQESSDRT